MHFLDRTLQCSDCHEEFVFTAGEQLFFHDKEFKNDPKRCKPCKSRRSGLSAAASGASPLAASPARTETRTRCSECDVETTVPFKPTQGRPVLCRQCFQLKTRAAAAPQRMPFPSHEGHMPSMHLSGPGMTEAQTVAALTDVSINSYGAILSADAAVLAAASMAAAHANSSVATAEDLASIRGIGAVDGFGTALVPAELLAGTPALVNSAMVSPELLAAAAEAPKA